MSQPHRSFQLEHLRTFLAVVRTGSLTRAADEVFLTQSALSRQIKELESCLDATLFERLGRGLELTATGRALIPEAERLLLQSDEVERLVQEVETGDAGELRIGATVSAANYILPTTLAAFHKANPRVRLLLRPGTSAKQLRMIRRNELDVAMIDAALEAPELEVLCTLRDDIVAVAPPDHPLTTKPRITPSDLESEEWILRESTSDTRGQLDQWTASKGIALPILMDMW